MFIHNFINCTKVVLRRKESVFWCLLFPILLATFMNMAFGGIYESEFFHAIPVAYVEEGNAYGAVEFIEALSEGEEPLLQAKKYTRDEAVQALENEEVEGIIDTKDLSLVIRENSVSATILKSILQIYKEKAYVIEDIIKSQKMFSSAEIKNMIETMMSETEYYQVKEISETKMNNSLNYFFAVFAMSCLFSSFTGVGITSNLQANISSRGMRLSVSPVSKLIFIISQFSAMLVIQFFIEVIVLLYMIFVLKLDFGDKTIAILPSLFVGCMVGLAIGIIVGSISKMSEATKIGMMVGISMCLSVMADLCVSGVKHSIEKTLPIVNKLNPAALITDCFYSLYVYPDYTVYFQNLLILAVEAMILIIMAFFMIRRNRYESL